ncbi:MAG TPA: nitrile hydratase accessory protein [Candidatus Binataceae bacterium]|nr:nitrile hydratase accessory protein [Candidatus Binataceae bacterium]
MKDRRIESLLAGTALEGDEIFSAPWEARAFAMALGLSEAGVFSWDEFRARLIEEIGASERVRERDGTSSHGNYYQHFLRALERTVADKGIVGAAEVAHKLGVREGADR